MLTARSQKFVESLRSKKHLNKALLSSLLYEDRIKTSNFTSNANGNGEIKPITAGGAKAIFHQKLSEKYDLEFTEDEIKKLRRIIKDL